LALLATDGSNAAYRIISTLLAHPTWVAGKTVCLLGAGVGLETVIIGRLCHHLYLNDLAPGALELCAYQLRHNGVTAFTCLAGRYERLALPAVDLLVGCFVVYNRETATAMRRRLAHTTAPVL
jgi:predicted nicotinamide N-methyase